MTACITELAIAAGLLVMIWLAVQWRKGDKEFFEARDRRRRGIFDD